MLPEHLRVNEWIDATFTSGKIPIDMHLQIQLYYQDLNNLSVLLIQNDTDALSTYSVC